MEELVKPTVLALCALVLVASCGSAKSSAPATTTVPGPTVRQVASVIAEQQVSLRALDAADLTCGDIATCPLPQSEYDRAKDAEARLFTIDDALTAIHRPPTEIRGLLAQTVTAVEHARTAASDYVGCFDAHPGGDISICGSEQDAWANASRGLPDVFAGWKPYGV